MRTRGRIHDKAHELAGHLAITSKIKPKHWFHVRIWWRFALTNLVVAATMGLLLRLIYIVELPINFRAWMHGHSHGAMLGWLFPVLLLLGFRGMALGTGTRRWLMALFALNQLAVVGMFVAFPYQSYGPVSAAFSTLQVLVSYGFIAIGWRTLGRQPAAGLWWRTALVFLGISTLGLWGVAGVVMSTQRSSELFVLAVQFFLHYQFNGWFFFAAFALLVSWLNTKEIQLPGLRQLHVWWVLSAVLTFSLAIVWSQRATWVYVLNAVAVALQLYTGWRTWRALSSQRVHVWQQLSPLAYGLLVFAMGALLLKVTIQAAVAVPAVAIMAFTIRNYVVGFIHLMMLGMFTAMAWALALDADWLPSRSAWARSGIWIFLGGVVATETLLFGQGTLFWAGLGKLPGYYTILVAASALLLVGALCVLVAAFNPQPTEKPQPA